MNYTEADLEDWAEENLAGLIHPRATSIARQLTLPSGRRIDLLFLHRDPPESHLTVVELKLGKVKPSAVAQLADYMSELESGNWSNLTVWGLLVSDGGIDDESLAIMHRMPRTGFVDLSPRFECVARHALWDSEVNQSSLPPQRKLELMCAASYRLRGDDHLDTIRRVVRGAVGDYLRDEQFLFSVPNHMALVRVPSSNGKHG